MKLAFIGLGAMGAGMAANLLAKSGAPLTVWNRSAEKCAPFAARGARAAASIAETAEADVIFLSLPDGGVVERVVRGEDGLWPHLRAGQTIVDTSTCGYGETVRLAAALRERGIDLLDAPVSGMEARAADGMLTVMCGGDEAAFARVRPLLECIGTTVRYMGKSGSGQLSKLINQLLFDINAAALAEILPLSVKMGLDSRAVGEIVNTGTGRSHASEFFIPRTLGGVFDEGYPLAKAYKDLVSAAELAAREAVPLPLLDAAAQTYRTALQMGLGAESKGAMIKVYERLLGVEFRADAPET